MLNNQRTKFEIQAQVIEFIYQKKSQIKAIKINYNQQEYKIKITEEVQNNFDQKISLGSFLEIKGTKKTSKKTGKIKLKANQIKLIHQSECPFKQRKSGTILVCKKSNCWQRGGQEICQILEENLHNNGLDNAINIKTTGCLKKCKQGPNVIFMPQKNHYTKVKPQEIPVLLTENNLI